jgi:DNA-binding Lrp family transcriptional regulator
MLVFVLIKTKPGTEFRILKKLENEPEIEEVYPIFGEYDFLVKILAKDIDTIGYLIINKIRMISGVLDTITLSEMKLK